MWAVGLALAGAITLVLLVGIAMAVAFPNLPDISDLSDYRPKLPLRVFSSDGSLIGEFGEERRHLTPIREIPKVMIDAVLAIEDARFYEHGGVDYKGILRAALANLGRIKSQGASTITMQVARNVYLTSEKTYTRKIYEILLTFKLEHLLSKDQILEIYMNQIFLGNRAYGFAAAAEAYFGKSLQNITVAEAAMLAGLPKAPSAYNPIRNPKRARSRQLYIIERMLANGFITPEQAEAAKREPLTVKTNADNASVHAEFVAETVRQLMFAQYGDATYTRGLNVFTTLDTAQQDVAYKALRSGIMNYERRQFYRGPEKFVSLPADPQAMDDVIDEVLQEHPDNGDVMSAVVLDASGKKIRAIRQNGEIIEITGDGLKPVQSGLSDKAAANIRIRRGAVIRVVQTPKGAWEVTQLPEVEGAFVAIDPRDGSIKALVGGFDFEKNKFNHVTQAWRQPGSSFKPFIYSAALESGVTPATIINDGPLFFDAGVTGGQPWEPKNYDGKFEGPMTMRSGSGPVEKHGFNPHPANGGRPKRAGLGDPLWLRRRQAPRLPDHGAWRRRGHPDADGRRLLGFCQWRLPRQPLADQPCDRSKRQSADADDNARSGRVHADHHAAQRVHHEQFAAGSHALGHGRFGTSQAQAPGPVWQDRHHQ